MTPPVEAEVEAIRKSESLDTRPFEPPWHSLVPAKLRVTNSAGHQRFWAFLDQGLVSLGNFATTVILARALAPNEYGTYALLLGSILFLNTIHAALVTYPLSIFGAPMITSELPKWATKAIANTVILGGVLLVFMCLLCTAAGRPDLTLIVFMALISWELQETTRSAFFAHLRQKHAILGDGVSYLGQAALIAELWMHGEVTLSSSFAVMALTSLLGFCVQAAQLRLSVSSLAGWREFARCSRKLGAWGLPARLAAFFTFQAFPWVLFCSYGAVEVGIYQAITASVSVSNPIVFSTSNLITATMAGSNKSKRYRAAARHGAHGLAIISVYYVLAFLSPHLILRTFFGETSFYVQQTGLFRLMIIAYALQAVQLMAGSVIAGLAETRRYFFMQAIGMVTAVLIGLPLTAKYGVTGAVFGFAFVQTGQLTYALVVCRHLSALSLSQS